MNVVLICREYPPDKLAGGIATYTHLMASGLVRLGHRVDVICQGDERPVPLVTEYGYAIHFTRPYIFRPLLKRPFAWLGLYKRFVWLVDWWGWSYAAYRMLRQVMKSHPVDVVEAPDFRAEGYACSIRQYIPLVVKVHSPAAMVIPNNGGRSNLDFRLAVHLEKAAIKNATLVTIPSKAMAAWLSNTWHIHIRPEHIIPNPIDAVQFSPAPAHTSTDADSGNVILYVGRLEQNKGVLVLLRAFEKVVRQVPTATLHLVGPDNWTLDGERKSLRSLLISLLPDERIRDRVILYGKVSRPELPSYYRRAAVCVFPTIFFDNFPYTCLEAMACGCPIVATRSGGMTEMIEDGVSGLLVPPGDCESLTTALVRMLRDRDTAQKCAQAARHWVEQTCAQERVVISTVNLYERIADAFHSK